MRPNHVLVPLVLVMLASGGVLSASLTPVPDVVSAIDQGTSIMAGPIPSSASYNEPSIDIAPNGRIFVTAIQGLPSRSPIWENVSTGTGWATRGGTTRAGEIGGGDAEIEFDSRNRGYHSDLWLGNDGMSVSSDLVNWIGGPVSHYVFGNDRQWFAHYQDQYLYTITNQLAAGTMVYRADINTTAGELGAFVAVQETPTLCICGPPGFPAVDQNNGNLYIPLKSGSALRMYRSTNDGLTFTSNTIGSATGVPLFAVAAVDEAGGVYVAFARPDGGKYNIYVAYSSDGTGLWKTTKVNSFEGTHVMPWIVAGEAGKVAVVWYGTTAVGNPNSLPAGTQWRVHYAQSLNANAASPTYTQWDLVGVVHHGTISTGGLTGTADRSLGDFMSAALNPTDGSVWTAFVRNDPGTPGSQRGVWVAQMPAGASPLT